MLESAKNMGQDTSEPGRATNAIPVLDHSQPIQEAEQMTRFGHYPDSIGQFNKIHAPIARGGAT